MKTRNETYALTLFTCELRALTSATPFLVNDRLVKGILFKGAGAGVDEAVIKKGSKARIANFSCMI